MPKTAGSARRITSLGFVSLCVIGISLIAAVVIPLYVTGRGFNTPTSRARESITSTVAGTGYLGTDDGPAASASFVDPFGIAVDEDGNVFVVEGGDANRIRRIITAGMVQTIAGSAEGFADGPALSAEFNTPSGIAADNQRGLIIADTSNNRVRRLSRDGAVTTIAGDGTPGLKDGVAGDAQFDGPVGVAVDSAGFIYVADTYNDAIRKISPGGEVVTLSTPGASFDTPCGVAVDKIGNIFVADSGNRAIRKITVTGDVETIAEGRRSGVRLDRPVGIAVTHDGFLFITDEGAGRILRISPDREITVIAGSRTGFADGLSAQFNGPTGIAVDRYGNIYVADTQNRLVRRITPVGPDLIARSKDKDPVGAFVQPGESHLSKPRWSAPRLDPTLAKLDVLPWPFSPQQRRREISGLAGEARGAPGGVRLHHLHSGVDVAGSLGESVLSILDEKVSQPIPGWDFDGSNEGIQIGLISYVHIRVGRDRDGSIADPQSFKPRFDEDRSVRGIRIRRGARFRAGDFIGTINSLYHVHLNVGPWHAQHNPLALSFIGFRDTIPPIIEPNGIEVVTSGGEPLTERRNGRLLISGDVDIILTAYDRADGNPARRKLGLYKLGYQVLNVDGTPAAGFEQPLFNIEFNRLPSFDEAVELVYAPESGVSAYGTPTKFKYIVTNRIRDGEAHDGFLRTAALPPGDYVLRVIAEDHSGNRASGSVTELPITITR